MPQGQNDMVELNIKTYDVKTWSQDEVFIDLRKIYSDKDINKFAFQIDKIWAKAKELISKWAKVERDSYDGQFKLLIIPSKSLRTKDTSDSYSLVGYEADEAMSDYETGASNYDISFEISLD